MKGTSKDLTKKEAYASWVFDNEEKVYNLKIKDETLTNNETNFIRIGNGNYDTGLIYEITEEVTGKKILRKGKSRPIKEVCGDVVVLHTRQSSKDDQPIVIEGNNGYYALAPRIESD